MSTYDTNAQLAGTQQVLSVSELSYRVKETLQNDFSSVWVAGEVSNVSQPQSGHIYLTLRDQNAQLRAVIWRTTAVRLQFEMQDGIEVLCNGEIDVYPPRGTYQLIIRQIEPRGQGALQLALRQLRDRLAGEGLFDPRWKKPLPAFPNRIAIVTSPTGAAIRDFLEVASRRWHGPSILVIPARVQGDQASAEIVAGISTANRLIPRPDVLVVARGGGSLEDLWCFNEERVVRAIHASRIPVVSAIGHEIDITLSDLAADRRALTPSEAAEIVVPSAVDVSDRLTQMRFRMTTSLRLRLENARAKLLALEQRRVLRRPEERLHDRARRLDELEMRGRRAIHNTIERCRETSARLAAQLNSLSPLAVLQRGYSVTSLADTAAVVHSVSQLHAGDDVRIRFADGVAHGRIDQTHG